MSKRRAILTLFRSTNFGCVSQALASVEALNGTVVNYVDQERKQYYEHRIRDASTETTWSTRFPLSRETQDTESIEQLLNDEFDEVFVGSDEILKFETADHRGTFLAPFPTPFWLSKRVTISKVLWAASVGEIEPCGVAKDSMKEAMARLSDFSYLSVRDEHSLNFIRYGSPELARRVEVVPDPTWLYWPRILFDTPMKYMRTDGVANSYHNLIAHLMRGHRVIRVDDHRPKTFELAQDFQIDAWDESRIARQCLKRKEAAWDYLRKVVGSALDESVEISCEDAKV